MFGKKYLEAAVISLGLASANCGEALSSNLDSTHLVDPSTGGKGGAGGSETGGMGGAGGVGGTAGCSLIKNLHVTPEEFSPKAGDVESIAFDLTGQTSVQVVIKQQTNQVKELVFQELAGPGAESFVWDGKNEMGVVMPEGNYTAEVTVGDINCVETEMVDFKIKDIAHKCELAVYSTTYSDGEFVLPGASGFKVGCFDFRTGADCGVAVEGITLNGHSTNGAAKDLLNTNILVEKDGAVVSEYANFSQDDSIVFNQSLGINIPSGTTRRICLESDISFNAELGTRFYVEIESASKIQAFAEGQLLEPTQIGGAFPLRSTDVVVGNPQ